MQQTPAVLYPSYLHHHEADGGREHLPAVLQRRPSIEMIENYYGHLRNRDSNVVSEINKISFTDKPSSKIDFLHE